MAHAISWFEIPAKNFERAKAFYEQVFAIALVPMDPARPMAAFPADWTKGEVAGAIAGGADAEPTDQGVRVFLAGGDDLAVVLARIEPAGGKVVLPKTRIPMEGAGFMAMFIDTEGNKIGLSSPR
jgi:predicted enzyme related to lactoylglutathione lyase